MDFNVHVEMNQVCYDEQTFPGRHQMNSLCHCSFETTVYRPVQIRLLCRLTVVDVWLTILGHLVQCHVMFLGHVAQEGEDDKA